MLFRPGPHAIAMATAKTSAFYLTETVTLPAAAVDGDIVQSTIDLGAYISVGQGIALAIDKIDFIFQVGSQFSTDVGRMLNNNGSLGIQVCDLNPGTLFLRADNQALVASGGLNIDIANNLATHTNDLYPDSWGPSSLADMFLCVQDQLYVTAGVFGADIAASDVECTAVIRARLVKLNSKDWQALVLQSVASDN
jgi:hypothetical protein